MSEIYLPDDSAVYHGDAFVLLKRVKPGSVDLILCDPPYNVSQANNLHTMGRRSIDFGEWDHGFDQTGWLPDAVTTLKKGGSIVLFNDWKLLGIIGAHLQSLGLVVKRQLRWRKCLSGMTMLYARTQRGDAPAALRELVNLSPSTVKLWTGSNWSQVISWEKQLQPIDPLELELRSGEIIRCTSDHRWPTRRGLVKAYDLVVGDVIESTTLPEPEIVARPSGLDDGLIGWFVGLYIAEGSRGGHKSKPKIQISGHINETARHTRLQQLADTYHGTLNIYNTSENGVSANLTGSTLNGIIDDYVGGHTAYNKRLNRRVWSRSDKFLHAVLLGYLDGNGHHNVKNSRYRLGFTRRNKYWARDLRTLAGRLGIQLRLKPGHATCEGKKFPIYRGEVRLSPSHLCLSDTEIISTQKARRVKTFWDVEIADEPHLFALASGVLTHNSNPIPRNMLRVPVQADECALWAYKPLNKSKGGWTFNKRPGVSYERGEFNHPVVRGYDHPNKKPDRVFQDIIEIFSDPGDLVLDPFAGGGTTAVAAHRSRRRHISFELDDRFYELAVSELEKVTTVTRR